MTLAFYFLRSHPQLKQGEETWYVTDLLENVIFQITFAFLAFFPLSFFTVTGVGRAALRPMKQVVPEHILCLRVVSGAFGVSVGCTATPRTTAKLTGGLLYKKKR